MSFGGHCDFWQREIYTMFIEGNSVFAEKYLDKRRLDSLQGFASLFQLAFFPDVSHSLSWKFESSIFLATTVWFMAAFIYTFSQNWKDYFSFVNVPYEPPSFLISIAYFINSAEIVSTILLPFTSCGCRNHYEMHQNLSFPREKSPGNL